MKLTQIYKTLFLLLSTLLAISTFSEGLMAQMITGVWHGKINKQKAEVKLVIDGDSLTGTSYYYDNRSNYRRYTIKGYFDPETNNAVWWDDQLIEEKKGRISLAVPGRIPLLSSADFNCPGENRMMLDGDVAEKEKPGNKKGEVHLTKTDKTEFPDEWDFLIDNFLTGANDPEIIDSIAAISGTNPVAVTEPIVSAVETERKEPVIPTEMTPKVIEPVEKPAPLVTAPSISIQEKFTSREKRFIKNIPVRGDSIELRFYDNAEIDGDSISLFLNNQMIFQHIRLTGNPYTIKLSVKELGPVNELTMVAENLGTIPPNTSYMVALVNDKRYDAYLSSNEGSSAMIRLIKEDDQ